MQQNTINHEPLICFNKPMKATFEKPNSCKEEIPKPKLKRHSDSDAKEGIYSL